MLEKNHSNIKIVLIGIRITIFQTDEKTAQKLKIILKGTYPSQIIRRRQLYNFKLKTRHTQTMQKFNLLVLLFVSLVYLVQGISSFKLFNNQMPSQIWILAGNTEKWPSTYAKKNKRKKLPGKKAFVRRSKMLWKQSSMSK